MKETLTSFVWRCTRCFQILSKDVSIPGILKHFVLFGEWDGKPGSAGRSHPTGEVQEVQAPPGSSGDFLVAMRGRRQGVLTVPSVSAAPPSRGRGGSGV